MKAKYIKYIVLIFFSFIVNVTAFAQNNEEKLPVIENLTVQQKEMLSKQKALVKLQRKKFIATLTLKQLAILKNNNLPKQKRQQLLMLSLTKRQKALLQQHRKQLRNNRVLFMSSFTDAQRQRLRTLMKSRMDLSDKKYLRDRIRDRRKMNDRVRN